MTSIKIQQTHYSTKPKTFVIEGFKLVKPRLPTISPQKQNSVDDWQHPLSPKPIKTTSLQNDLLTTKPQPPTPDTTTEDLYEIYQDAPDNYILRQVFEPEKEQETQQQDITITQPKETQTEHLNQQSTSTTQTDNETMSELTKTLFCASPGKQPLLDNDVFNHLTTDEGNNIMYLNLSTNLTLKKKRHINYFPMDFEKLTLDGLIDTGALTSAISEADLNKIKLLSNEAIKDSGPAPNFQIMVANGQLERPIGTVLLELEVADFQFQENFIVMKTLPNPLIGLCFLQRHNALFDIRQGIITFQYLSHLLAITTRTHNKYPCSNTFADRNRLYPSTRRNFSNIQQNATLNRS